MKKSRTCAGSKLYTGASKCPPDFKKVKGAIIVQRGYKLPADLTADKLEELAHADDNTRIFGILPFVEYANNGGEVQVADNGYGGPQQTGVSTRTDTFTMAKFDPSIRASIAKCKNKPFDVYFFDKQNMLIGQNDGTDVLAGIQMALIYAGSVDHPTSSAATSMTVSFAYDDAEDAIINWDYYQADVKFLKLTLGLTPVVLAKTSDTGTTYKILEKVGGYDVTSIYGPLVGTAGTSVITGTPSAVTYNTDEQTLTITVTGGAEPHLKSAGVLYANDIKGIEEA